MSNEQKDWEEHLEELTCAELIEQVKHFQGVALWQDAQIAELRRKLEAVNGTETTEGGK